MGLTFSDILMLALLPVLLAASAFFSGSETALFSLSRHDRLRFSREKGIVAEAITALLSETRSLLITILLGNMTVNVLVFVISTVLLMRYSRSEHHSPWLLMLGSVLPLLAVILLGEVLPKLLSARMAVQASRLVAAPLFMVHRAMGPVRLVMQAGIVAPMARLIAPRRRTAELSAGELQSLVELSQSRGIIDAHEEQLLQQVLSLSQLKVRDIMKPRVDVIAFDADDDPAVLLDMIRLTFVRRIPVFEGDLDHILGILDARRFLVERPTRPAQTRKLVQPVMFVPEQQRVDRLLTSMRQAAAAVAIVVDEFGGTAGLVTLEDILEQVVGQIAGAYEPAQDDPVRQIGPGQWRVSADLGIGEWAQTFGLTRHLTDLGVSTLGGVVMAQLGRVPRAGDRITLGNLTLEVLSMRGRRVDAIMLRLVPAPDADSHPQPGASS